MAAEARPPAGEVFVWDPATFELGLDSVEVAPGERARIYSPGRTAVDLMRMRHSSESRSRTSPYAVYLARRELGSLTSGVREGMDVLGPVRAVVTSWPRHEGDAVTRPTRRRRWRAYLDLQDLARRQGRQTQTLMVIYVLERFLARLEVTGTRTGSSSRRNAAGAGTPVAHVDADSSSAT